MEIQRTQAIMEDSWKVESEPGQFALTTPYLSYQCCKDGPLRPTCWEEEQKRSVAGSSSSNDSVITVFTFADEDFVKEKDAQLEDQKTTWKKDFMKDLGPGTKLTRSKSWQYPRKLPSHSSVPRSYSMNAICTTPFIELLHLVEKSTRSFNSCTFQNTVLTSNSKHRCSATSVHATAQIEEDQSTDLNRIRTDNENWYRLYLEAKRTRQIVAQEPVHGFPCGCSNAQCDGKMAPLAKKDCRTWLWKVSQKGHEIERYGLSNSWKKDNRMWLWKTTNVLLRKQRRKDIRVLTELKI